MSAGLAVFAIVLLVYAALHDLAVRTIPNWLPLLLLVVGVCARLLDHSLMAGMLAAVVVFALLFGLWLGGGMGGGDVKLWAASVLLVPPVWRSELFFFLHVVMFRGMLAILYLLLSFFVRRPRASRGGGYLRRFWRVERWRIGRRRALPYACAIAAGTIAALLPNAFQT